MAEGDRYHIVRQGEHLARIAYEAGVQSRDVWDHPANEAIAAARTPDQLAPGDVLVVPRAEEQYFELARGGTNRFTVAVPRVTAEVALRNREGRPLAGEAFVVEGLPVGPIEGQTDGDGVAQLDLPVGTEHVELVVPGPSLRFRLRVGALDPTTTEAGVRSRLIHLGHLRETDRDDEALEAAIRGFQSNEGNEPTGELDDETLAALAERHGS